MGNVFETIEPNLVEWIGQQKMFFVATAPLDGEGLVNCSPKGLNSFRILGPNRVAYLDLHGSGIETVAHLRENRRIVIMFCAFEGSPKILRLYGRGVPHVLGTPEFESLLPEFPEMSHPRSIIEIEVTRIADSCGFGVPKYEFVEQREALTKLSRSWGAEKLTEYREEKNAVSLDGLPGFCRTANER